MKYLVSTLLFLLLFSCSNDSKSKKNSTSSEPANAVEDSANGTTQSMSESETEGGQADVALSPEEHATMKLLRGNYYSLEPENDTFIYQEACEYYEGDLAVSQKLDDMAFWEIRWFDEILEVINVEEKEDEISITTRGEDAYIFIFSKNKKESVWDLIVSGYADVKFFTRAEEAHKFVTKPCTDASQIMAALPETFYEISEVEGQSVLYEPCEDAPGGITITESTIDFWSGSDPYQVVSMSKLFNRVTLVFNRHTGQDSIIMQNLSGSVFKFGKGSKNDSRYVSEQSKDIFPTVKEEC